jgi:YD repeat-containing protein
MSQLTSFRKIKLTCIAALLLVAVNAAAQFHPFISFDVPGAVGQTFPTKMNAAGQVTGYFTTDHNHGFIRNPDGQIVQFDAPGTQFTQPAWKRSSTISM